MNLHVVNKARISRQCKNIIDLRMAALQRNEIVHGNIKPSNVFISDDGFHLLIGDFLPKSNNNHFSILFIFVSIMY